MLRADYFKLAIFFLLVGTLIPSVVGAQEVHQDIQEVAAAEVLQILDEREEPIIGTEAMRTIQEVRIKFTSGEREGEVATIESEVVSLAEGDNIFVLRSSTINGLETVSYSDFERRPILISLALLFVGLLLILSRWQGVRALLSLAGSVAAILFILVPALLAGYDPAITTVGVAAIVMAFVLFGTHGINSRTTIAFVGVFGAVVITGIISYVSVYTMRLTGFSSDASVYLNFATKGQLDFAGLLLGSIIIGILGVLDDVSITQASVVEELKAANPNLSAKDLYLRAIKVGRDHIGSLVNTLALAYAGVSLPLILLYAQTESNFMLALNQEVIATELIRIIIGSIGLILAVPATTAVAAWYYQNKNIDYSSIEGHHHHHSH